jgi:hypothetical protein
MHQTGSGLLLCVLAARYECQRCLTLLSSASLRRIASQAVGLFFSRMRKMVEEENPTSSGAILFHQ